MDHPPSALVEAVQSQAAEEEAASLSDRDINEIKDWLRIANLDVWASKTASLLRLFGSPSAIFDASDEEFLDIGLGLNEINRIRNAPHPTTEQIKPIEDGEIQIVTCLDPDYPPMLQELFESEEDVPVVLFYRGSLKAFNRPGIAIVGTRRATPYGMGITERFAKEFARAGMNIISGGASGVDTCAHTSALGVNGVTTAVLGSGVDRVYPPENKDLFDRISLSGGVVISEFPPTVPALPFRFPIRNRTISALSLGVLVIEAPKKSGSLITASCAAEHGREVYVIPGSITNANFEGSHSLIKDGAALVDCPEDILSRLKIELAPQVEKNQSLTENQQKIINALSLEPIHPDALSRNLDIPTHTLTVELTLLELAGLVKRIAGGLYVKVL